MKAISRSLEDKFILQTIAGNPLFSKPFSFDDVIQALESDQLVLEVNRDEGVETLDDSIIEEILRAMPSLLSISEAPIRVLIPAEEKVPVETANRINHKAVSYLSRDSKDWYARTVLNVRPKTVLADISYESLDTYENRFVCTLVWRLLELSDKAERACRQELENYDNSVMLIALAREMSDSSLEFYNRISKNTGDDMGSGYLLELNRRLESVLRLKRYLRMFMSSDLYKALSRKGWVREPIHRNNALIYDRHYRRAYELWIYLRNHHYISRQELAETPLDREGLERSYRLYCMLCIFAALHDMGFGERSGSPVICTAGPPVTRSPLDLHRARDGTNISFHIESDGFHLDLSDDSGGARDILVFRTDYADFEAEIEQGFRDRTKGILDSLYVDPGERPRDVQMLDLSSRKSKGDKKSKKSPPRKEVSYTTVKGDAIHRYQMLSIDLHRCVKAGRMSDLVYRRLYSVIGDFYSDEESGADLQRWGSHNTGIAIVCPSYLRDSFLKIEKIVNFYIVSRALSGGSFPDRCPACGERAITSDGADRICYCCNRRFSSTFCKSCDPRNEHPILWIKYRDEGFLSKKEFIGEYERYEPYQQMRKVESLMRECTATSFLLLNDNGRYKLKTVCPRCGRVLGS